MMKRTLKPEFFERSAIAVARDLIGKYLVRRAGRETMAVMITETEAYIGPQDLASHSSKGRTARTEVMFGPPGRWYVYFTYGMHWMLNIVTGKAGHPAAVLIRGTADVSGPARLTRHLGIDRSMNALKAAKRSGLWLEDRGASVSRAKIRRTPRIGVDYAGPVWANKHYRFVLHSPGLTRSVPDRNLSRMQFVSKKSKSKKTSGGG